MHDINCIETNSNLYIPSNIIDEGGIPSQFPVQEETQFLQLLRESLDFFSIDEKFHSTHVLIDYKTRKHISKHSLLENLFTCTLKFQWDKICTLRNV